MKFKYFSSFIRKYWLFHTLYFLSGFSRRNSKYAVFGSHNGEFKDNSKYLFIYMNEHRKDLNCVWISKNKKQANDIRNLGYKSHHYRSIKGVYYCLVSKFYFYTSHLKDINYWISRKAIAINLWHGLPMKKIEFSIKTGPLTEIYNLYKFNPHRIRQPHLFRKPDFMLSTSPFMSNHFSEAFKISPKQCLEYGQPRLDHILYPEVFNNLHQINNKTKISINIKNFSKVFLYLPTWRDTKADILDDLKMDFKMVNSFLDEHNALMLVKLHPITPQESLDKINFPNIKICNFDFDIYSILDKVDCLITDYSSIFYDFISFNSSVILYTPDIDTYLTNCRELNFNYEQYTSGLRATNMSSFITCLNEIILNKKHKEYSIKTLELKNIFFKENKYPASKLIVDRFF